MYGIKGIDHLCRQGQLRRVLAGSYPSGGSKLDPPLIRQLIHNDQIQALNIPSGVLFQMHRAASTGQPGVLTEVGLGTYADPRIDGAKMNAVTDDFVQLMKVDGNEYLFYPAVDVDVAIIRATTADPVRQPLLRGGMRVLSARLIRRYAAHNNGGIVIAQVKRLSREPAAYRRMFAFPGFLSTLSWSTPIKCRLRRPSTTRRYRGEVHRDLDEIEPVEFGLEKVIARRAAAELQVNATVNLGLRDLRAQSRGCCSRRATPTTSPGSSSRAPWAASRRPGSRSGARSIRRRCYKASISSHCCKAADFDVAMLSFLEVSGAGDVNASYLPARPHVTAGVGGFNDIITRAPKIVFSGYFTAGKKNIQIADAQLKIISDGSIAKFVPEVAQISFSGEMGRKRRQEVLYITERCVIELTEGGLTVIEIAPGVDLEKDVLAKAGVPLLVSPDLQLMSSALFRPESMGLILSRKPSRIAPFIPEPVSAPERPGPNGQSAP